MKRNIPILLYHHIAPDREITPHGFEMQMRRLQDDGYHSLSMTEVLAVVRGERPIQGPVFALTFDDGYLDNWIHVFPILTKLKMKATMYVVTDYVEDHAALRHAAMPMDTRTRERAPGGFFSWQEARAMVDSGWVEIGSHTQSHRNFIRKDAYRSVEAELRESKALIEEKLERSCDHLAWPWGDYDSVWLPLVKKIGYRTAVTTRSGANTRGTNPLVLKRIKVSREGSDWLARRLRWQHYSSSAAVHGFFYGWDRRFKRWAQRESPYAHG